MYTGELDYIDSNDFIEVHSLILRAEEIAFDLTTTWEDDGKWSVFGCAKKTEGGKFVSGPVTAKHQTGHPAGYYFHLEFEIIRAVAKEIELRGAWCQFGDSFPFRGVLEIANQPLEPTR